MGVTDWEERYRKGGGASEEPHPLLVEYGLRQPPGRALDLACGLGRHALWLAQRGWQVSAVDSSRKAIETLSERSHANGVSIDLHLADLESDDFAIEPMAYDLIVVVRYLQRNLFPSIRAGVRAGGVFLSVIAMVDDDPAVSPMNPDYLLEPNELRSYFSSWELLHDREEKSDPKRRAMAELVARRPF
jgi:tellurite methyltransferase